MNTMEDICLFIYELFCEYIKREPSDYEIIVHSKRFKYFYNFNEQKIKDEFINCQESRNNINLKKLEINNKIERINIILKSNPDLYKTYNFYLKIVSPDNIIHQNILIRHHHNIINNFTSFNPIIGVNDGNIIEYTNSYLHNSELQSLLHSPYENYYKIYKNIDENYNHIINDNIFMTINNKCLYLGNSFLDSNIGHALSYIFYVLDKYINTIELRTLKIIITDNTYDNIIKILLLFVEESQLIKLEQCKTYKFNDIIIHQSHTYAINSIDKYIDVINYIINSYEIIKYKNNNELKNKKILMIKTENNNNGGPCKGFKITNEILLYCNQKDILYIIPEKYNIYELIFILNNASIIVTSPGAISFTHMIFFNKNANLYFIGSPYFYSNKLKFTYLNFFNMEVLQTIFS